MHSASTFKSHGYYLSQAMRFTVQEINNSSALLPNVTLGCDIHDTCSEPANLHATLRALARGRQVQVLPALRRYEPGAVAVIGPDSTELAVATAAILGVFLVPQVSATAPAGRERWLGEDGLGSKRSPSALSRGSRRAGAAAGSASCVAARSAPGPLLPSPSTARAVSS